MNSKKKQWRNTYNRNAASLLLTLLIAGTALAAAPERSARPAQAGKENPMTATTQGKFFCNLKALTPEERAHHNQLSEKLLAARKATVETAQGYEFQFSPRDVTLAELADWVVAENKCCPFFDFHLDLENEGRLLCLRLTGEEGIKQFIRSEFHLH